jgi:ABC-2 type transport system permease protein
VTRLVTVELRRLCARRLTRVLGVALLLGVVAAGIGMAANSSRDSGAARAKAQQQVEDMRHGLQSGYEQCVATVPAGQVAAACPDPQGELPGLSAFYVDPRFSFHDHAQDLLRAGVLVGGMVALLLAASAIGAEWQAGTFASLLTWEPRRRRVAAAKVLAAVVVAVTVAAIATALLVAVAALVAGTRGTFDTVLPDAPVQTHFARHTWAMAGRGAAVVTVVAAAGAGLTLLLRHTVAALGTVIGYLIVGEGIIGSLRHGDVRHHLLQSRLAALLDGAYSWMVPVRQPDGSVAFGTDRVHTVHAGAAGMELLAIVLVLLVLATLVLQRRDVT